MRKYLQNIFCNFTICQADSETRKWNKIRNNDQELMNNDIAPEFKGIIFRDGEAEIMTFEAFK